MPELQVPKVLVIDDDDLCREYVSALLTRAGYAVHCLADGGSLAAVLEGERFAAIVTDLYMPRADGIEVLQQAKQSAPGTPVIVISGRFAAADYLQRSVLRLGAAAALKKPFHGTELLATLDEAIAAAGCGLDI
jgi:two-component system C4-dicarboxylate transport response regulator DctD